MYLIITHFLAVSRTLVGDSSSKDEDSIVEAERNRMNDNNQVYIETELLHSVKKKNIRARKEIFKHALVQFFVETKFDKMKLFTISSVIFDVGNQY